MNQGEEPLSAYPRYRFIAKINSADIYLIRCWLSEKVALLSNTCLKMALHSFISRIFIIIVFFVDL